MPRFLDSGSPILLGRRADQLSLLIERQIEPIFEQHEIDIPVRSCSLLIFLRRRQSASAADLAKDLGYSHQLVLQKIPQLMDRGLIVRRNDPKDRRRRVFHLTPEGVRQMERLDQISAGIERVYQQVYEEIGLDLFQALGRAIEVLNQHDLHTRLNQPDRH